MSYVEQREGVYRRHDEYQHTRTWIESMTGGPFDPHAFDPHAFDIDAVNAALKALR